MTQGQTVYVQWYGKVLQSTVVQNTTPDDPLLGCMVAVSIPIQGTMATALFTPAHVYQSENPSLPSPVPPPATVPGGSPPGHSPATVPGGSPPGSSPSSRLQRFKADHWDHDHNHLRIDALDEFYALWREYVAASSSPRYTVGLDLAADTEPPQPHSSSIPSPVHPPTSPPLPRPKKRITATQLSLLFE